MGASEFVSTARGNTAQDAFGKAREEAQYESGHGGYSGTIAEKHTFKVLGSAATLKEAHEMAGKLLEDCDPRIDDKWGPAGCITVPPPQKGALAIFVFFGWASS